MRVEILVEDPRWDDFGLDALAQTSCAQALRHVALDPEGHEVSLLACDDPRIAELNAQFRGKATPTNVLSWPSVDLSPEIPGENPMLEDAEEELGDIAIAWSTCAREAEVAGKSMHAHVQHLLVHGTLHLLGYDHDSDKDAALMERLEIAILAELGAPNPYVSAGPLGLGDG